MYNYIDTDRLKDNNYKQRKKLEIICTKMLVNHRRGRFGGRILSFPTLYFSPSCY